MKSNNSLNNLLVDIDFLQIKFNYLFDLFFFLLLCLKLIHNYFGFFLIYLIKLLWLVDLLVVVLLLWYLVSLLINHIIVHLFKIHHSILLFWLEKLICMLRNIIYFLVFIELKVLVHINFYFGLIKSLDIDFLSYLLHTDLLNK